jgi:Na+/H+ antiporter NhaA
MSLFVSVLSFVTPELLNYAKLVILLGSILSAVAGIAFLAWYCAFLGKGKEKTSVQE